MEHCKNAWLKDSIYVGGQKEWKIDLKKHILLFFLKKILLTPTYKVSINFPFPTTFCKTTVWIASHTSFQHIFSNFFICHSQGKQIFFFHKKKKKIAE